MATGTVKWFNLDKGFGFIQPQDSGKDVFVHITALQAAGISGLNDGQKVTYDVVTERGKQAAANLKLGWLPARMALPPHIVRGRSRFRLRVFLIGEGLKPFGWEVYDDEDGRSVRRDVSGFRTSAEAWQAGSALLDELDMDAADS